MINERYQPSNRMDEYESEKPIRESFIPHPLPSKDQQIKNLKEGIRHYESINMPRIADNMRKRIQELTGEPLTHKEAAQAAEREVYSEHGDNVVNNPVYKDKDPWEQFEAL